MRAPPAARWSSRRWPIGARARVQWHDIADRESRGVVAVLFASPEFADVVTAQSRALGLDVLHVLVPQPIQDRTGDELLRLARDAYPAVLASVTAF